MVNGPCGDLNMTAPCMDNGKCIKSFLKVCINDTITNADGYLLYRRRDTDNNVNISDVRFKFNKQIQYLYIYVT